MKTTCLVFFAATGLILIGHIPVFAQSVPSIMAVPESLPVSQREELSVERVRLMEARQEIREKTAIHNRQCTGVEENSPFAATCADEQALLQNRIIAYGEEVDNYNERVTIKSMNMLAQKLGWNPEELKRLDRALNELAADLDEVTHEQIDQTWEDVIARSQKEDLVRQASEGNGPGFLGAGEQTSFSDCAIFALANATGRPYGVVAALAAELIREGTWRKAKERENPQNLIETSGLNGGEIIMLAEAFGHAEVIKIKDFAKTLKEGRSVMVNVIPESREGAHEIVLTKIFQYGGEAWFEAMDSNQGPLRRLYFNEQELSIIILENGVAFRPEPGATPKLLR